MSKHSKKMISADVIAQHQEIFRCPICFGQMQMVNLQSLICINQHCFDVSKRGYVNLLTRAFKTKYDKRMFESRRMICRSGFFEPLNEIISDKIIKQLRNNERTRVLDAGCGEGSQLTNIQERILQNATTSLLAIGIDISKEGINSAAAEYSNAIWCVADIANCPFANDQFNFILNILSPANYSEFHRMIADQAGNQATTTVTHIHIDKTKPVTHAALTPSVADGANGWYLHPVTVQLTGEDALSGVDTIEYSLDGTAWRKYTGPVTIAQDGRFTVSYRSTDKAGNQEQPQTVSFNLDTTGPVVSISVPAAGSSYPVSGDLVPDYTTSDSLSGLDSSKTTIALNGSPLEKGVVVPIYTLPLGANTVQVTARDMAGNVRSATVSFATYADLDSLKALVTRFEDAKEIDNRGVANSLQSKLKQGNLQAFIQEVKAQSGKHITSEAAAYLQKIAQALPLDTMVPVTTFQYTPLKDAKENYISGLPVILSEIDSELWVLNGKY